MPSLQPAVFPPRFKELPSPNLELYDLDEQFSSEKYIITKAYNILELN